MYIKKITISGLGPISHFNLEFPFDSKGNPIPVAVIGTNGSGKTLFLANILDGLIELKKKQFNAVQEVSHNAYLKICSKAYVNNLHSTSFVNIEFQSKLIFNYDEVISKLKWEEFEKQYSSSIKLFPRLVADDDFKKSGFFKEISIENSDFLKISQDYESSVIAFFPHSRYDHPAWLTKSYDVGFQMNDNYYGRDYENIIKKSNLQEIETWLLDVLLDQALYEHQYQDIILQTPEGIKHERMLKKVEGKNSRIVEVMNNILTTIFKEKFCDIQYARLGVSTKQHRRVSVILHYPNNDEVEIASNFSFLSSGEALLVALFGSILKSFDFKSNDKLDNKWEDISGIVIIDEIDLHLHIAMTRKILPNLIKLFPKIQFIFSTHSPFLLLGLKEGLNNDFLLLNMPTGNFVAIDDFSETQEAYRCFVENYQDFYKSYKSLQEKIEKTTKPLVITEGKTDWKHIKNAYLYFRAKGEYTDLDINFLEYEDEITMGDSALLQICQSSCKIPHEQKIICIFDLDNPDIIKTMSNSQKLEVKNWTNNVFSFCIPKPVARDKYENISIEFYYSDDEIKTIDRQTGKRLFFTNELKEKIVKSLTTKQTDKSFYICEPDKSEEFKKKIFDQDCHLIHDTKDNQVAHSKAVFAQKVYNKEEGFNTFNLENFKQILDIIENIVWESKSTGKSSD